MLSARRKPGHNLAPVPIALVAVGGTVDHPSQERRWTPAKLPGGRVQVEVVTAGETAPI